MHTTATNIEMGAQTLNQASDTPWSSTLSLGSSSVANSSLSEYTTTTSSTVSGLGETSGRVILALGKVALRGAEYLIIRRRLDSISANFPHQNTDQIPGLDQFYDDILEISRHGLYPDTIRVRALTIILAQIGSRQTQKLIEHLLMWPFIEIKIFIAKLADLLDPLRLHSAWGSKLHSIIRTYIKSVAIWEDHCLVPFVVFLKALAEGNDLVNQAIIEGGGTDYLLQLYVSNFFDPLVEAGTVDFHQTSTLRAECCSLLRALSSTSDGLSLIREYPLHVLWSHHPELPFTPAMNDRITRRVEAWKELGTKFILWRIRSIMEMVTVGHGPHDQEPTIDIIVDILEFSGSDSVDPKIWIRALRSFHRLICNNQFSTRHNISQYLALSKHKHFAQLFSRIIIRISHLLGHDTPEWDTFYLPWDEPQFLPTNQHFFKSNAVLRIINAFIGTARYDQNFLTVISEANILGLLRPFLQREFETTPRLAHNDGDQLLIYDPTDFEFLAMIREHGLRRLYPPVSDKDPDFVELRRPILSQAFDVVLRREKKSGEMDGLYRTFELDVDHRTP